MNTETPHWALKCTDGDNFLCLFANGADYLVLHDGYRDALDTAQRQGLTGQVFPVPVVPAGKPRGFRRFYKAGQYYRV